MKARRSSRVGRFSRTGEPGTYRVYSVVVIDEDAKTIATGPIL
jgi:hypothetical protein